MPTTFSEIAARLASFEKITPANAPIILGVSATAPVSEIRSAYKALVLLTHPDKNQTIPADMCNQVFNKIHEAYETCIDNPGVAKPSEPASTARRTSAPSFFNFNNYMRGYTVRAVQDIMCSFAGVHGTMDPSKTHSFFKGLQMANQADPFFEGHWITNQADRDLFLLYADRLFPREDEAAREFSDDELQEIMINLRNLARRYPELAATFNCKVTSALRGYLDKVVEAFKEIPKNTTPDMPDFQNFSDFERAFLSLPTSASGASTLNDRDVWMIFDAYAKENQAQLKHLVHIANILRSQPGLDQPFVYSDTALEKDTARSRLINDKLCQSPPLTRRQVLEMQLQYLMYQLLGDRSLVKISSLPEKGFPQHEIEFLPDNPSKISGKSSKTSVLTGQTVENTLLGRGKHMHPPQPIVQCIPSPNKVSWSLFEQSKDRYLKANEFEVWVPSIVASTIRATFPNVSPPTATLDSSRLTQQYRSFLNPQQEPAIFSSATKPTK